MKDREIPSEYNDHRAAHKVYPVRDPVFGQTCVKIPYRGVVISLARDGGDTVAYDDDVMIVEYGVVPGTSGESVRKVMDLIDEHLAADVSLEELIVDIADELEYNPNPLSWDTTKKLQAIAEKLRKTNT